MTCLGRFFGRPGALIVTSKRLAFQIAETVDAPDWAQYP
jgi:hypothetical protein